MARWRAYVRLMRQVDAQNYCHPDNQCWDDCCEVAYDMGEIQLRILPQLIREATDE